MCAPRIFADQVFGHFAFACQCLSRHRSCTDYHFPNTASDLFVKHWRWKTRSGLSDQWDSVKFQFCRRDVAEVFFTADESLFYVAWILSMLCERLQRIPPRWRLLSEPGIGDDGVAPWETSEVARRRSVCVWDFCEAAPMVSAQLLDSSGCTYLHTGGYVVR